MCRSLAPYRPLFLEEAMFKKPTSVPANLQPWIDARRKFHLSHARMNPKKLGKLDNHRQEPWKLPLPQFSAPIRQTLRQGEADSRQDHRGSGSSED
jgi:hypothetical protein